MELPLPFMLDADAQKPPMGKWPTPPFDPRFPNQNQTRNCYQNFLGAALERADQRRHLRWQNLTAGGFLFSPPGDPSSVTTQPGNL
ncbi:uncharacterized protein LOC100960658 isoform X3 [Otolemur garnettii]|uniref:uncharacterized protein LOC100960658 isoform X3 n=1 Tax=Otolemur garnettii TaxID=30611 RepID=UPI000C7F2DED|nr:uncharacterized protein LOC100960658 isoform X3 [Otolemur garnettii]